MYPLELIKWVDHTGFNEWKTLAEVKEIDLIIIETVGWIVNETPDAVVIVSTLEVDGERCHSDFCIYKPAILSRQVL